MDRERMPEQMIEREELTLDEFETLEVIELPERELMTSCGGSGGGLFIGVGVCVNVKANVSIGLGGGTC